MRGVSLWFLLGACSFEPASVDPPRASGGGASTPDAGGGGMVVIGGADASTAPSTDAGASSTPTLYAHTEDRLYEVDVEALTATLVGSFAFPSAEARVMSDVAIDRAGTLVGISFDRVYTVGASTANCLFLATLDDSFNGLAFVPAGVMDATKEVLVGATNDGYLYSIDPASGLAEQVGAYGPRIESSGDLVYVPGQGLLATVIVDGSSTDSLARIDPLTGHATVLGDIGFGDLWGLAWQGSWIYGFTPAGDLIRIDPVSGAGTAFASADLEWYGAAVAP